MKLSKNKGRNLKKQTKTSVYVKPKLKSPVTTSLKIEVQLGASFCVFVFILKGRNCKIHGPRSSRIQDEFGKCGVLQADRCLLHGSGTLGNDIPLQCSGRYVIGHSAVRSGSSFRMT